jgi:hypothetical protein
MARFGTPCTRRYSALTFAQVQAEIGANRPFLMYWDFFPVDQIREGF